MDKSLLCAESFCAEGKIADKDIAILDDQRVLDHLLETETTYMPSTQYFKTSDLDSSIRKKVTEWMLEVCEQEGCRGPVLPLAVNLFDRFLSKCGVPKHFLQLIAADCILIASKIRLSLPIPINTLCYYTDHSVTPCQLRNFETLIATKLKWDLAAVTSFDFIDQIIQRVTWCNTRQEKIVRAHSITLLHLCCTEVEFFDCKPSMVAAACLVGAMRGIRMRMDAERISCVCHAVHACPALVDNLATKIERIVAVETVRLNRSSSSSFAGKTVDQDDVLDDDHVDSTSTRDEYNNDDDNEDVEDDVDDSTIVKFTHRHRTQTSKKPETPVDVQNVKF